MKLENNKCIFILMLFVLSCVTACNKNSTVPEYNYLLENATIKSQNLKSEKLDLEKDNTLCYMDTKKKNNIFYFSYPIQNSKKKKFDFKFVKNSGYVNDLFPDYKWVYDSYNSKWVYPKTLTNDNNIFGVDNEGRMISIFLENVNNSGYKKQKLKTKFGDERETMVYKNANNQAVFYNTLTGFVCETIISQTTDIMKWQISTEDFTIGKTNPYYITFCQNNNEDEIQYIFQTMGCYDSNGNFHECKIDWERNNNIYNIKLNIENLDNSSYPLTLITSFEHYVPKAIIDSETNTKMDYNSYLKSYTILGQHEEYGDSELNIRFSTSNLPKIKSSLIESAKLRIKNLGSYPATIKAYMLDKEWCSWQLVHNNKPLQGKLIGKSFFDNDGYYYIDITDIYKSYLNSDEEKLTEQGVRLKVEDGYTILPTADNSLYPISVVVRYAE